MDSVTSLKFSSDDLLALEEKYPDKNFIYVFQVTKNGKARGTNEFMHNVDIVIEIPERGKAVQYGRFNQGGEMDIFENEKDNLNNKENVSMLDGIKSNPMKEKSNEKATQVFEEIKQNIEQLKKVIDRYTKDKKPNWGTVGSLAHYHESLGTHLSDTYTAHQGYSKSVAEGMQRHSSAIQSLLKELLLKTKNLCKQNAVEDLKYWNGYLKDLLN